MTTLDPFGLLNLADGELSRRVVSRDLTARTITILNARAAGPTPREYTITQAQYDSRVVQAAAVMFAESGGQTDVIAVVPSGPHKGSHDRGVWQYNDEVGPTGVTDQMALDPVTATRIAADLTQDFASWVPGPWALSNGLNHSHSSYQTVLAAWKNSRGTGETDPSIWTDLGSVGGPGSGVGASDVGGAAADAAAKVFGDVFDWAKALGKLLSTLISPAFWRRFGVGVLGAAFVLLAVLLLAKTK